ncbi:MAG TPA: NapC/NirT family cytochrome c [Bryobacteraceae bacterium]|nr:NapC/NirT family cytochrome c [Bryobacteraceae bacterium]
MMRIFSRNVLSPLVHLSNNWISLAGVVIVTTATIFWLFLLPVTLRGEITHPYIGILVFLLLPGFFFAGLLLIPLGIVLRRRHERGPAAGASLPPLNWSNADFRRLALFVGFTTFVNIAVASQLTYGAVDYMDSVTFCGLTCHKVMQPEYTAHQNSPHARVACVECHIGPGASWFVRSKLSGVGQVFAAAFDTYPRPIPVPVQNLRPARETCEVCHWPQRFDQDKLVVIPSYAEDAQNTASETVLLVKIGGRGRGIHGVHVGEGVHIRYAPSDESRQTIPWVEYEDPQGHKTIYSTTGGNGGPPAGLATREMDCIDCHNRPTHTFQMPGQAIDNALAAGLISPALPFVRKQGLQILKKPYATRDDAAAQIPAALTAFYRDNYAATYQGQSTQVQQAGQTLVAIYNRNVFPAMKITWGTYPNNIGHNDFPGCFRCHDGNHTSASGKAVTQDCGACHNVLAVQETNPKILTDLGVTGMLP